MPNYIGFLNIKISYYGLVVASPCRDGPIQDGGSNQGISFYTVISLPGKKCSWVEKCILEQLIV